MPPEKFPSAENENTAEGAIETAGDVETRLIELGWTKEQVGDFAEAIQTMANEMTSDGEASQASAVPEANFELNIVKGADGDEVAEVTIVGEGRGLSPEQLSKLIDGGEFFMKVFTEADPEFFAGQNKVILRRKKNREPEPDIK
jgi:hypothetical protein